MEEGEEGMGERRWRGYEVMRRVEKRVRWREVERKTCEV
jgi:hypothetical protein